MAARPRASRGQYSAPPPRDDSVRSLGMSSAAGSTSRYAMPTTASSSRFTRSKRNLSAERNDTVTTNGSTASNTQDSYALPNIPDLSQMFSGTYDNGVSVSGQQRKPRASRFVQSQSSQNFALSAASKAAANSCKSRDFVTIGGIPVPSEERQIIEHLQEVQQKLATLTEERDSAMSQLQQLPMIIKERDAVLSEYQYACSVWERNGAATEQIKDRYAELDHAYGALHAECETAHKVNRDYQRDLGRLTMENQDYEAEVKRLTRENEQLKSQSEHLTEMNEENRQREAESARLTKENDVLHKLVKSLREELATTPEYDDVKKRYLDLFASSEQQNVQYDELQSKYQQLIDEYNLQHDWLVLYLESEQANMKGVMQKAATWSKTPAEMAGYEKKFNMMTQQLFQLKGKSMRNEHYGHPLKAGTGARSTAKNVASMMAESNDATEAAQARDESPSKESQTSQRSRATISKNTGKETKSDEILEGGKTITADQPATVAEQQRIISRADTVSPPLKAHYRKGLHLPRRRPHSAESTVEVVEMIEAPSADDATCTAMTDLTYIPAANIIEVRNEAEASRNGGSTDFIEARTESEGSRRSASPEILETWTEEEAFQHDGDSESVVVHGCLAADEDTGCLPSRETGRSSPLADAGREISRQSSPCSVEDEEKHFNGDSTLRPSQPPAQAISLVIRGLEDELWSMKQELVSVSKAYRKHDASGGRRSRVLYKDKLDTLMKAIEQKSDYVYNLYDVLAAAKAKEAGEQQDFDFTEWRNLLD